MTLPLAELHCHIEGAVPPDLALRLASRYGESIAGLISEDGMSYRWSDFTEFLAAYDRVAALFRAPEDLAELSYTHYSRLADLGAIYGEVFISADHARSMGLSYAAYVGGLAHGMEKAKGQCGIEGRMIATAVRHLGTERAVTAAELAVQNPHPLVAGFGLAGDERMFAPEDFVPAFAIAGEAGLGLTAHAGEVCGPESVRATLDVLPVKRLGHGVRAAEDSDLVTRIIDEDIVLEVCPGSNIALGIFADIQTHPLGALHRAGAKITLNSDDPPFFRTTLAREYEIAAAGGLRRQELVGATRTAIEAAFVDGPTQARLLARLDTNADNTDLAPGEIQKTK